MGWQRFSIEFSSLHFRHHGSGLRSRDAPEPMASAARGVNRVAVSCQTSLTALTGAKGIFLRCQTVRTGKSNKADAQPLNVRYFTRKHIGPPAAMVVGSFAMNTCGIAG